MPKQKVDTIEKFTEIVDSKSSFLLIKHSLTCPISQSAFDEFEAFHEDNSDVNCYYLFVQEARQLSAYIAETYEVKHESPQVILFDNDGKPVWNASHWKITYDSLSKEAVNANSR